METRIKTTDYTITADISKYLFTRLAPIEKMLADLEPVRCESALGKSGKHPKHGADQWFAELDIKAKRERYHASAKAETLKAAIDMVKDELTAQVRKAKDVRRDAIKKGGKQIKEAIRSNK